MKDLPKWLCPPLTMRAEVCTLLSIPDRPGNLVQISNGLSKWETPLACSPPFVRIGVILGGGQLSGGKQRTSERRLGYLPRPLRVRYH